VKKLIVLGGVCLGLLGTSPALAATANANLTVKAKVVDACSAAAAEIDFNTVNPGTGTTLPQLGTINVTCTLLTPFSVGLSDGTNHTGSTRRMRRGATSDYLTYELYKDILMSTRFGDTDSTDRATGLLGLGILPTPVLLYGAIPGSQSVSAGDYEDTVQITVYY
jgi:spore coat protein U-like protein